jgi:hypothetical protein
LTLRCPPSSPVSSDTSLLLQSLGRQRGSPPHTAHTAGGERCGSSRRESNCVRVRVDHFVVWFLRSSPPAHSHPSPRSARSAPWLTKDRPHLQWSCILKKPIITSPSGIAITVGCLYCRSKKSTVQRVPSNIFSSFQYYIVLP